MNAFTIQLLNTVSSHLFFLLINKNRERLEDFFAGTVKYTQTPEDTHRYCMEIEQKIERKEYFPYLIIDSETEKIIGFIDVKNIDWNIPKAELGAFIDKDYEGRGIITRVLKIVIDRIVSQHGFKKLLCRISDRNTRSINVALRCGFELEGTIRRDYRTTDGTLVDLNYYGKLF